MVVCAIMELTYFLAVNLMYFCPATSSSQSKDGSWATTPGDVWVLEGTSALFNWTYANMDPVDIAFDYIKSTGERDFIMAISNGKKISSDKWNSTAIYQNFSDSAAMVLTNVTSAYNGKYKVTVVDKGTGENGHSRSIKDVALLTIMPASNLTYTLTYDDDVYELSVGGDDIHVVLPMGELMDPAKLQVIVNFTSQNLKPSLINVKMPSGNENSSDYLCENKHVCRRKEWILLDDGAGQKEVDVFITMHISIQNLRPINIRKPYMLRRHTKTNPTRNTYTSTTPWMIAGIIFGLSCICVIGIVVWCKWEHIKNRLNVRSSGSYSPVGGLHYQRPIEITDPAQTTDITMPIGCTDVTGTLGEITTHSTGSNPSAAEYRGQPESVDTIPESTDYPDTRLNVSADAGVVDMPPAEQIFHNVEVETNDGDRPGRVTIDDLNKHVITNLHLAEYMFQFEGDTLLPVKNTDEHTGSWQAGSELAACITMLLNTSGGLIILHFGVKDESRTRDLMAFFSRKFVAEWKIIPVRIYKECINIHQTIAPDVHIMVSKSRSPVTYQFNTSTYVREGKECKELHDYETAKRMISMTSPDVKSKQLDDDVTLDPNIDAVVGLPSDASFDVFTNELIAMGNARDGGYIVLNDHLSGFSSRHAITEKITMWIELKSNAPSREWNMIIWGSDEGFPKVGVHWTVCQVHIAGDWNYQDISDSDRLYWVMKINACQGGAFLKEPECFAIRDDGNAEQLEFAAWKYFMTSGRLDIMTRTHVSSLKEPDNVPATHFLMSEANEQSYAETSACAMPMKWSSTETWKQDSVSSIQDLPEFEFPSFRMSKPMTCTPRQATIEGILTRKSPTCIQHFREHVVNHGWLLAFCSIARAFNYDSNIDIPPELCMDLLMKVSPNHFKITSIFVEGVRDANQYSLCAARVWKKYLLNEIARKRANEQEPISVCVEVSCIIGNKVPFVYNTDLDTDSSTEYDQRIADMLMASETCVNQLMMEDLMKHQATKDQDGVIRALSEVSHLVVSGPPGSGKTYMAQQICCMMSKKYDKDCVLYVSCSAALCEGISSSARCKSVCAHSSDQFNNLMNTSEEWECVVIDDAHAVPCQSQDKWKWFLSQVRIQRVVIFLDDVVMTQTHRTNVNSLKTAFVDHCSKRNIPSKTCQLWAPHRSSQKILSFVKSRSPAWRQILENHSFVPPAIGDDIYLHSISAELNGNMDHYLNLIITLVQDILGQDAPAEEMPMYEPRDIAVIVDSKSFRSTWPMELISQVISKLNETDHTCNAQKACITPEGVVVDTLENFFGLQSKVVLCVMDLSMNEQHLKDHYHVPYVASRAITRVDFICQVVDEKQVIANLGFNKD